MKNFSAFILLFTLVGHKSLLAREVSSIKHTDVSNSMNQEGMICPFQKSFSRKNNKREEKNNIQKTLPIKYIMNNDSTIGV